VLERPPVDGVEDLGERAGCESARTLDSRDCVAAALERRYHLGDPLGRVEAVAIREKHDLAFGTLRAEVLLLVIAAAFGCSNDVDPRLAGDERLDERNLGRDRGEQDLRQLGWIGLVKERLERPPERHRGIARPPVLAVRVENYCDRRPHANPPWCGRLVAGPDRLTYGPVSCQPAPSVRP
jgi:hypothetical protein